MDKLTITQVKEEYAKHGFMLVEKYWKNTSTPCMCIDSDGYLYNKTISNIRQMGRQNKGLFNKPFDTRNKYFWENVLYYMDNKVSNETKLLSVKDEFRSCNCKLLFQCAVCGKTFQRTWKSFIDLENKICTSCYKDKRPLESYIEKRRNQRDRYKNAARKIGLTVLSEKITNSKSKVKVMDKEGYKGIISASRLLSGSSFEKWSTYRNPYIQYNLQLFVRKNGFKSDVMYVVKNFVKIRCECGEEYTLRKDALVYGCQCLCKKCTRSMSLLERKVESWLKRNKISHIQQKTFTGLVGTGGNKLRFDFYIPDFNICIEVNGRQHYENVTFGHTDRTNCTLDIVKLHDERKRQYCKKNNIKLLEIPYWDIENSNYISIFKNHFLIKE